LGITEKLGASGRGEKKIQKRRKRTDRRKKSLCFFSLGGKKEVGSAGKFLRVKEERKRSRKLEHHHGWRALGGAYGQFQATSSQFPAFTLLRALRCVIF
jgi:hypothetical protein